jgi:carboxypeptidase PM20D1
MLPHFNRPRELPLKRLLAGVTGAILVLAGIVLFRTFTYGGSPQGMPVISLPDAPQISAETGAAHLAEAVRFQTVTYKAGDPAPEDAAPWHDLHRWLETTYPRVHSTLTLEKVAQLSLLYRWQGSEPTLNPIILMAHQDVVPVNDGTLDDWSGAPFAGDIIDGAIYGRGALDDKGSLVAIMEAAEALLASGFQPTRTVYLMFGHDEEVSGSGAQAMVDLLDTRGVRAEMVLDEGFFVIKDSPLTGKAFGFIGVAEKGYASLQLTAIGAGGHSSNPPRNSANVRLARAILALEDHQMKADFSKPPVSDLFAAAAADMGFAGRMALANLWLFRGVVEAQLAGAGDAMIRTTTAPTMLKGSVKENVLPQRATALVNFRLHPNDTFDELMAHVANVTAQIEGLEIAPAGNGISSAASPVSPANNRAFAVLSAVAGAVGDGAPSGPALVLGGTDARWASKISDNVYRFQPSLVSMAEVSGFHGTNERLSVANMGRMASGYAQIILAMDSP